MSAGGAEWLARQFLGDLPARIAHVAAVARRGAAIGPLVAGRDVEVLVAACWLHDIGYGSDLAGSTLHNVNGAAFLRGIGEERFAGLVAYHSAGPEEARLRGMEAELQVYVDESSPVSQALTYCDLTTAADGSVVSLDERLADVCDRYGPEHVVSRALSMARSRLELLVAELKTARSCQSSCYDLAKPQ